MWEYYSWWVVVDGSRERVVEFGDDGCEASQVIGYVTWLAQTSVILIEVYTNKANN